MNKSVTIGIPVYLVEDVIRDSFESALNQTYEDIDFVVVDDCGNDDSIKIVNEMIVNHPRKSRVRIVCHEHNLGLGEARNTIIKYAKTDFVYFMDSDDRIAPNTIELLLEKASKHGYPDITISSHKTVYQDGSDVVSQAVTSDVYLPSKERILTYFNSHYIRISSWNKLFSRQFLIDNEFKYVHRYHEDFFFSLQEIYFANSILIVPDITYFYILRSQSITGGLQLTEKMVDRLIPVKDDIKNFILLHKVNDCIIAKKYVNLITHILYIAFSVEYSDKNIILNKYKQEKIPLRFLNFGITFLSKVFIIGSRLPKLIFPLYWKIMIKAASYRRQ